MVFGQKCEQFLNELLAVRNSEIDNAVQQAIANEYVPFEAQVREFTHQTILREVERKNNEIARIEAKFSKFVEDLNRDADAELSAKHAEIEQKAKETVTAKIDDFILGVSKLADKAKLMN